jgi:hypothetical protein
MRTQASLVPDTARVLRRAVTALTPVALLAGAAATAGAPLPGAPACPVLPADNVWNARVDGLPSTPTRDA